MKKAPPKRPTARRKKTAALKFIDVAADRDAALLRLFCDEAARRRIRIPDYVSLIVTSGRHSVLIDAMAMDRSARQKAGDFHRRKLDIVALIKAERSRITPLMRLASELNSGHWPTVFRLALESGMSLEPHVDRILIGPHGGELREFLNWYESTSPSEREIRARLRKKSRR